jgi:hypothetical protein
MLSAFSRNTFHKKREVFPFYELGRTFTDAEISVMRNKVEVAKTNKDKYKLIMDSFNVVNPAADLPNLLAEDRVKYINASRIWSKARIIYTDLYPKLIQMMQSQGLPKAQPVFKDILDTARQAKKFPSEIIDEWLKKYSIENGIHKDIQVYYPDFVIMMAQTKRTNALKNYSASTQAQKPLIPYWVDRVIHDLDLQNKNTKLRQLVDMRIQAVKDKGFAVKENERALMKDVIREHLGVKTLRFQPEYVRKVLNYTDKDKSDLQMRQEASMNQSIISSLSDNTNKIVSPVNTVTPVLSQVVKTVTPKSITSIQPTTTQVRSGASLLSGYNNSLWNDYYKTEQQGLGWNPFRDISNAFNSVANVLARAVEAARVAAVQAAVVLKKAGEDIRGELEVAITKVAANTIGSGLAKDLLPSELYEAANKLTKASIEIMVGKISPERIGNALEAIYKIGAVGSQSVSWVVDETTGAILASPVGRQLDQYTGGIISSVDRLADLDNAIIDDEKRDPLMIVLDVVKVASVVSGAGSLTGALTNVGEQAAGNYVGQQSGLNKTALGRSILSVGTGSVSGGGSMADLLTKEVKTVATGEATKQSTSLLIPMLGKDGASIIGGSLVSSGISSYSDPNATFMDSMQTNVTTSTKSVAKGKANTVILQNTGGLIGLNQVEQIYNLDPKEVTKDNANKIIDAEIAKVHKRISDETTKSLNVKEKIKHEYQVARAKISDPDAIEKLQDHTKRQIDAETKKLADKIDGAQNEMNKALDSVKNFDLKDEIAQKKAELEANYLREKERFQSMTMDDVFDLAKQYGPDLLKYLMSKYGAKPNYDKVITEQDLQNYKTWTPTTVSIYPPKKKGLPKGLIMGSVAVVGAYMVMKD